MKQIVLALDLGGTNMRFSAVASDGSIVARYRRSTPANAGLKVMCSAIVSGFERVRDKAAIRRPFAIAAAVPTTSCNSEGKLSRLPNLPVLDNFELGAFLRDSFNAEIAILNDATAATVGEHWLGVSRGVENVIGVTLGTGVGGGLIIDGKPLTGKDGSAGEIGHLCIEPDGRSCGCGSRGCLEQYASGSAILQRARDEGLKVESAKVVFALATNGNRKAAKIITAAGRDLGIAFAGLVNVMNPDMIVVGGGISGGFAQFSPSMISELKARAFSEPSKRVRIVRARLGDKAGVVGAARLAFLNKVALK